MAQLFNWDGAELSSAEKARLEELLDEFEDVVAKDSSDLGRTSKVYHRIPTGDAAPIKQAPRLVPFYQREELERKLREMLDNGIIKPSTSPWASPVVLVRKKDGGTRVCADYGRLNDVTRKDAYPIARIDSTFDALGGAKFFSTIDLASGYWQVEVDPQDREKTAFVVPQGPCHEFWIDGCAWDISALDGVRPSRSAMVHVPWVPG